MFESNFQLLNPTKLKPSLTLSYSKFLFKTPTGLSFANSDKPNPSKISNDISLFSLLFSYFFNFSLPISNKLSISSAKVDSDPWK